MIDFLPTSLRDAKWFILFSVIATIVGLLFGVINTGAGIGGGFVIGILYAGFIYNRRKDGKVWGSHEKIQKFWKEATLIRVLKLFVRVVFSKSSEVHMKKSKTMWRGVSMVGISNRSSELFFK